MRVDCAAAMFTVESERRRLARAVCPWNSVFVGGIGLPITLAAMLGINFDHFSLVFFWVRCEPPAHRIIFTEQTCDDDDGKDDYRYVDQDSVLLNN